MHRALFRHLGPGSYEIATINALRKKVASPIAAHQAISIFAPIYRIKHSFIAEI